MTRTLAIALIAILPLLAAPAAHAQAVPSPEAPNAHDDAAPTRTAVRGIERSPFSVGLDVIYTKYFRLEDIACAPAPGVTMCKVENTSTAARLYAEYDVLRNISIGGGISKTSYGVWTFAGERQFDLYVNAWSFDTYSRWKIGTTGSIQPYAELGGSYIYNDFDYSDPEFLPGSDTQSGVRLNLGAGLELNVLPEFSVRTQYNYVSGGGSDADSQHRFAGGLRYRF